MAKYTKFHGQQILEINDEDLIEEVKKELGVCWPKYKKRIQKGLKFPSPQPVSISLEELLQIKKDINKYWISPKAHGEHFLCFFVTLKTSKWIPTDKTSNSNITSNISKYEPEKLQFQFLIGRNYKMYLLDFQAKSNVYDNTLFAGELIKIKNQKGQEELTYLIFDIYSCCGYTTIYNTFKQRLEICKHVLPLIRNHVDFSNNTVNKLGNIHRNQKCLKFQFKMKEFFPLTQKYFQKSHNSFEDDGHIIIHNDEVLSLTFNNLYKIKFHEEITGDFLIIKSPYNSFNFDYLVTKNKEPVLYCSYSQEKLFSIPKIRKLFSETSAWVEGVWECYFDLDHLMWLPFKLRTDKLNPNSQYVIDRTYSNCMDNITPEIVQDILFKC